MFLQQWIMSASRIKVSKVSFFKGSSVFSTSFFAKAPSYSSLSTSGTNAGHAKGIIVHDEESDLIARSYAPLCIVPEVPKIHTSERFVALIAARAPGKTTPTTGKGHFFCNDSSATAVAVLHATTSILIEWDLSASAICHVNVLTS
jgi:hypothetical protein